MTPTTLNYLHEFRARMLKCVWVLLFCFALFFYYANPLFALLTRPIIAHLNGPLLAINVTAPLIVPIELAAKSALLLTLPLFFYQIWAFIAPALHRHEHKVALVFFAYSLFLFFLGITFCYFIILPLLFGFFTHAVPDNVQLMPDISQYLSLTSRFLLLFGLIFQIPVVLFFLSSAQLVSKQNLIHYRPYVIVGAFTVGMLLTPPDVLSQLLLALPMCVLYEIGIFFCGLRYKQADKPSK